MNETHDALRIWYKGNGYDTLFLDDGTPAYFIAAEVGIGAQRGLFVSPMCFLEGVSTAFETLARGWAYSGGTFFLYRKRFITLSGDVVSVHGASTHTRVSREYLARRNPFLVNTPVTHPTHDFALWRIDPDARTRTEERALNTLEDLENALQQTTEGLYLGLEVLTGCTYYYKM